MIEQRSSFSASRRIVRLARRIASYETVSTAFLIERLLLDHIKTYVPAARAVMLTGLDKHAAVEHGEGEPSSS